VQVTLRGVRNRAVVVIVGPTYCLLIQCHEQPTSTLKYVDGRREAVIGPMSKNMSARTSDLCFRNIDTRCPRERNFRTRRHCPIHQSVRRPWKFELWGKTRLENCRALWEIIQRTLPAAESNTVHYSLLIQTTRVLLSILFDLSHSSLVVLLNPVLSRLSIGI
jgi:hypothetical protein